MKLTRRIFLAGVLGVTTAASGCRNFLDVNSNPNGPQTVTANLYLAPMVHWMVTSPQYDGRFIGHLAQEWYSTSANNSPGNTWEIGRAHV